MGKKWFISHILLNVIALILIVTAFVIAIVMVDDDFKQTEQVNRAHAILGLVTVILLGLQIIIGIVADRLFDPNRSKVPIFPGSSIHNFLLPIEIKHIGG